jgi:hypothetical protein
MAQITFGVRAHRERPLDAGRSRDGLDGPHLEVDRALADERAGANGCGGTVLVEASPGERAEEADRVVLRAVALPVAPDDLLPTEPPGPARPLVRGELVDSRREGVPALPADGLAKRRITCDLPESPRLVVGAEDVQPRDGKARTPHGEVPPDGPVTGQTDQVVIHRQRA